MPCARVSLRQVAAAALVVASAAGCAPALPCAADLDCPAGTACVDGGCDERLAPAAAPAVDVDVAVDVASAATRAAASAGFRHTLPVGVDEAGVVVAGDRRLRSVDHDGFVRGPDDLAFFDADGLVAHELTAWNDVEGVVAARVLSPADALVLAWGRRP